MVANIKGFTSTVASGYCQNDELDAVGRPFLLHPKTSL
jgi:hypothetical protein